MKLFDKLLYGGDYNPDQWLDEPDILEKDIERMKEANVNCVTLGVFAWSSLEPEEGVYDFKWLGECIDKLYKKGIYTILATPSGARPVWLAKKYPEVLRVASSLHRNHMGQRHNHCYTSPVYRKKVWEIDKRLSESFGRHPGVILWHLSNEYGGECYCPLCQEAFRGWLKKKYKSLETLNKQWWTRFWSHVYTDWDEIEPPLPNGEDGIYGLTLDWKRFVSEQTADFCGWEKAAVRAGGSELPVTTNFMGFYEGLNYTKFRGILDIVSWDCYPFWHMPEKNNLRLAVENACTHDFTRCLHPERKPFLMMESSPSNVNWSPVSKLKRPGMNALASMQAVGHGSDSVQYFQWRKSRGEQEKFCGAVLDHYGESDTRVFDDVAKLGKRLQNLSPVCGSFRKSQVAILFDQENRWAMQSQGGPRNIGMHYLETIIDHYQAFWQLGISVDVIDPADSLTDYSLVVAPMLYLYQNNIEDKMKTFVSNGGTLVGTYFSGIVNENDLCFLGKTPHQMTEVFGLWREEIDALCDGEQNQMQWREEKYILTELCERVHPVTAQVLSTYEKDFYQGEAVFCKNCYGKGEAYYLAAKAEEKFYFDFYESLADKCGLSRALDASLSRGVTASIRESEPPIIFVQNFNSELAEIVLHRPYRNFENDLVLDGNQILQGYEVLLLVPEE